MLALFAADSAWAEEPAPTASAPARPPPFAGEVGGGELPRTRHIDVGAGFVFISPVANSLEDEPAKLHYNPGPGGTGYARILLHPYLQAAAVFSWATHSLETDEDALGAHGLSRTGNMTAYRLEAHILPTLPIGDWVRLYAIVGLGWGRIEFGTMHADYNGDFVIRGRGASYFDVPAGLGTSIEVIPRWLGVDIAMWAAPTFAKQGTAHTPLQAIDGAGHARTVGPLPEVPVWFVQSLGLSVLL